MTKKDIQDYINKKLKLDGFTENKRTFKYPNTELSIIEELRTLQVSKDIEKLINCKVKDILFGINFNINIPNNKTIVIPCDFFLSLHRFVKGWLYYRKIFNERFTGKKPEFFDHNNTSIKLDNNKIKVIKASIKNIYKNDFEHILVTDLDEVYHDYKMAIKLVEPHLIKIEELFRITLFREINKNKDIYKVTIPKTDNKSDKGFLLPDVLTNREIMLNYLITDLYYDIKKVKPIIKWFDDNINIVYKLTSKKYGNLTKEMKKDEIAKDIKKEYEEYIDKLAEKNRWKELKEYYKILVIYLIKNSNSQKHQIIIEILDKVVTEQNSREKNNLLDSKYGFKKKLEMILLDYLMMISLFASISKEKTNEKRISNYLLQEKLVREIKLRELEKEYLLFEDFILSVKEFFDSGENKNTKMINISRIKTDSGSDDQKISVIMNESQNVYSGNNKNHEVYSENEIIQNIDEKTAEERKNLILLQLINGQQANESKKSKEIRDKRFLISVIDGIYSDTIDDKILLELLKNTTFKPLKNMLTRLNIEQKNISDDDLDTIIEEIDRLLKKESEINTIESPFVITDITIDKKRKILDKICNAIPDIGLRIVYFLIVAPHLPEKSHWSVENEKNIETLVISNTSNILVIEQKNNASIKEGYESQAIQKLENANDKYFKNMLKELRIEQNNIGKEQLEKVLKKIGNRLNLGNKKEKENLEKFFEFTENEVTITIDNNFIEIDDVNGLIGLFKKTDDKKFKKIFSNLKIEQNQISNDNIKNIIGEFTKQLNRKGKVSRFFTLSEINKIIGIPQGTINTDIDELYMYIERERRK